MDQEVWSTQLAKSEGSRFFIPAKVVYVPFGQIDELLGGEGLTVIDENESEIEVILGLGSKVGKKVASTYDKYDDKTSSGR